MLLLAVVLVNGSNYLFHVVVSRPLGPSDYGALAALLAVLMVVSVPFAVLQTVVTQRTAALRAQGRPSEVGAFAANTVSGVLPVAVLAAVATLVLAAPLLSVFLDVTLLSSSLLAPYVLLATIASIPLGVLQGSLRFGAFAGLIVGSVVVRLASGIGFVHVGLGVPGAMLASVLAAAVPLAAGGYLIRLRRPALTRLRASLDPLRGEFRVVLYGMLGFWILTQADLALARHFLEPEDAGFYSSGGLLARILLFMPGAVAFAAFPRFVEARERGTGAFWWLRVSLLACGLLVFVPLPFFVLLDESLVELTFGERFLPAADVVPLLCVAMAVFALVGVMTLFHIAMGSHAYVVLFAGAALEVVLIALFHDTQEQIATSVALVSVAVAGVQFAAARSLFRWRPPLERLVPAVEPALLTAEPTVELSVVLPCHNAGVGLRTVLETLLRELDLADSYEIIVVSDGSTDETVGVADEFSSEAVRVFHYPTRGGKGHALQVGLMEARGRYVAFVDADGDIGAEAIRPFLTIMRLYEPDIVLGSKRHPLSEVQYPRLRRLMSWTYHKLARLLFRVNVRDTQTGLKLLRRDVLAAVLPRLLEKRYAFDLELLVVARLLGYRRVFEAPVRIDYKFGSQVKLGSVARIALDTAAIFYRHYVLGSYRIGRATAGVAPFALLPGPATNGAPTAVAEPVNRHARQNGRLRILFLNWRDLANPDAGGAEVFTHEVARRWVAAGHDVSLLAAGFAEGAAAETRDGVHVRRLGRLRSGSFHLALQRELARLRGFDVVIDGINTIPSLAPIWRGRLPPTVALVHQLARDVWDCELPRPLAAIGRWAEPRLLRPYRDVPTVAVSDSTAKDLIGLGFRHVVVIPPGRDDPPDLGSVAREAQPTFLFVGRLAANKRPDHAVQAFRHIRNLVPDARLWIVGRGPLEHRLAADLPSGAELLGFVSRHELYDRMARAHCVLVPSVREGWGLVVIEANSVGTPVVAYDVPGLRDSVCDWRTGLLAPDGDSLELARRALAIVQDPVLQQTLSRAAMAWADRFSWDQTAETLLEVIEEWRSPRRTLERNRVETERIRA